MVYSITIVGLGVAGILTLAHIPTERLSEVLVIEGNCIGGDLASLYSGILANITKAVIVAAFQKIPRWAAATFPFLDSYQDTDCPKLGDVCLQIVSLIRGDLDRVECRTATATSITDNGDDWSIQTSAGTFRSKKVVLCIGGMPKVLDIPRPAIPLHVALSKEHLVNNVTADDNVVVFGTSHSGTLVMRNLKDAGVRNITGVYRGKTPFLYARDGHSEGIKQESATVADEILAAAWGEQTPTRRTSLATRVVYAHGFQRRSIQCIDRQNNTIQLKHNPADGSFDGYVGRLWGFGLAYPSTYVSNGATYSDIGFAGFITAIATALPAIL